MFKKGQKVVCIAYSWNILKKIWFFTIRIKRKETAPVKDKIYTVADYGLNTTHNIYYVELKEFPSEIFSAKSFVPIDETFAEEVLENIKEQINEDNLVKL